ncbi:MAG TPA: ATP-binding protein [Candidatus Cloacimonadota bacterium]|nr:ATP-binding protein [Candidatus Cloacimonadota bacterium]
MKRRSLFKKLYEHLDKRQITLLLGARQTGKTTLLKQLYNELLSQKKQASFISLEDHEILNLLNTHPRNLFNVIPPFNENEKAFVFIDEIQYLVDPTNFLKYHYDLSGSNLKMVVSGSSAFYIDAKFKDSLAGRKRIFQLPTLSLEEFLIFKDKDTLAPYLNCGKIPEIYLQEMYKQLNEYLLFGGYPAVVLENDLLEKKLILKDLVESYIKKDIEESNLKTPKIYYDILKMLAANSGLFNANNFANHLHISQTSVILYVTLMKSSFHITEIRPYHRNSTKELRKMPKIYLNDLGLRNYLLNNFEPIATREDRGDLLENFVFRRFYDMYEPDEIKFWRTQKKQEVDFIIQDSKAYEVKFTDQNFKLEKYKFFTENYPEIPLNLIHFGNVLKVKL